MDNDIDSTARANELVSSVSPGGEALDEGLREADLGGGELWGAVVKGGPAARPQ